MLATTTIISVVVGLIFAVAAVSANPFETLGDLPVPPKSGSATAPEPLSAPEFQGCNHDKLKFPEPVQVPHAADADELSKHAFFGKQQVNATGGIRFHLDFSQLQDPSVYCPSAGVNRSDLFAGGTATCASSDVLTTVKNNTLVNYVLPEAIRRLSAALHIKRRTSNIIAPPHSICGENISIPEYHRTEGVADADYVLYVNVPPGAYAGGTVAAAASCGLDGLQPVVGFTMFNPREIEEWNTGSNELMVKTAMHEILHALGFGSRGFKRHGYIEQGHTRGKQVTYFTGPNARERCRTLFNCPTLPGCELEDFGGSGTASSHFEARNHLKDLMRGYIGHETELSEITLAVMEDLGYIPQYDQATAATFGKGAGCGFTEQTCNLTAGGRGRWFDFDFTAQQLSSILVPSCSANYDAIGFRLILDGSSLVDYREQYWAGFPNRTSNPYADNCPAILIRDARDVCHKPLETATTPRRYFSSIFDTALPANLRFFNNSAHGRCAQTEGSLFTNHFSCFATRCLDNGTLQVALGSSEGWSNCPAAGGLIFAGTSTQTTCPPTDRICGTSSSSIVATRSPDAAPLTRAPVQITGSDRVVEKICVDSSCQTCGSVKDVTDTCRRGNDGSYYKFNVSGTGCGQCATVNVYQRPGCRGSPTFQGPIPQCGKCYAESGSSNYRSSKLHCNANGNTENVYYTDANCQTRFTGTFTSSMIQGVWNQSHPCLPYFNGAYSLELVSFSTCADMGTIRYSDSRCQTQISSTSTSSSSGSEISAGICHRTNLNEYTLTYVDSATNAEIGSCAADVSSSSMAVSLVLAFVACALVLLW